MQPRTIVDVMNGNVGTKERSSVLHSKDVQWNPSKLGPGFLSVIASCPQFRCANARVCVV